MTRWSRRHFLEASALGISGFAASGLHAQEPDAKVTSAMGEDFLTVKTGSGAPVLRYVRGKLPAGEPVPAVEGTCFTHPIHTPAGEVVTDLAPADHRHHRGVFCAWVEVDGARRGDWWGWGAKAPKEGCVIRNREARISRKGRRAGLDLHNTWLAGESPVVEERLLLSAGTVSEAHVLDFEYRFSAPTEKPVTIAQSPFGGFCYRARPRGTQVISGPEGEAKYLNSVHTRSETNWPASPWYDMTYRTPEGRTNGVALINHPGNPATTWHVVRGIHMLNPCIVAQSPVVIEPGKPLVLRYRLVAHDGDASAVDLRKLFDQFAR